MLITHTFVNVMLGNIKELLDNRRQKRMNSKVRQDKVYNNAVRTNQKKSDFNLDVLGNAS